jgi:acetyl-CoA acetyltransferase
MFIDCYYIHRRRNAMPLYMDIHHKVEGLTADAVMHAHEADVETQAKYGVQYLKYWFQAVLFRGQLSIRRESEK